jgi:ABC-2 type transport system permease protein
MKALLKIEWIKTWRSWPVFIMSIGMPVGFFLLYSGMEMSPDPESQKAFILSYMLTMTGFSMSSFGFFTFPYMLREDQTDHWLTYIDQYSGLLPVKNLPSSYELYGCYPSDFLCRSFCA